MFSPALDVGTIWGVNQQIEDLCLSLSLFLCLPAYNSTFQIKETLKGGGGGVGRRRKRRGEEAGGRCGQVGKWLCFSGCSLWVNCKDREGSGNLN